MKRFRKWIAAMLVCTLVLTGLTPAFLVDAEAAGVPDGVYVIPVSLWNASIDQASMGNGALMQTGKLVVTQGQGQLYMKFSEMTFSGMTGYLSALDLLEDISFNSFQYPEKYRMVSGTVCSQYDVVDAFNGQDSTDVNCAGKNYPKVIRIPVSLKAQNIWAHVYVPVMGSLGFGDQLCRIHLDWDQLRYINEEETAQWREYENLPPLQAQTQPPESSTADPGMTGEPAASRRPWTTGEPKATVDPGSTGMPDASRQPWNTGEPEISQAPGTTGEPEASQAPGATGKPGGFVSPGITGVPEDSAKPGGLETPKPSAALVNKDDLAAVLSQAKSLVSQTGKYSEASLNNLQRVIDTAQKAYEQSSSQTVIDGQCQLLRQGISALVEKSIENLDKNNLPDGKYYLSVNLWNATSDKASMGDPALNHEALLMVKDGVYQLDLSTHTMTVGTITACLQTLQIKQTDGTCVYADIVARDNLDNQPSVFRFTLPVKEDYIDVLIDPKVEVMGKDPLPARLKLSWDTLKAAAADAEVNTTPDTTSAPSEEVSYKDPVTKLRVQAEKNVFPQGTKITVKRIRSGKDYTLTSKYMKKQAAWRLYRIQAKCDGKDVAPLGMVTISVPVPASYQISSTVVYRVESSGLIKMTGSLKNKQMVLSTNTLGLFSIAAEKTKTGSQKSTKNGTQPESAGGNSQSAGTSSVGRGTVVNGTASEGGGFLTDGKASVGGGTQSAGTSSAGEASPVDGMESTDGGTQTDPSSSVGSADGNLAGITEEQLLRLIRETGNQEETESAQEYHRLQMRLPMLLLLLSIGCSTVLSIAAAVIVCRRNGGKIHG